MAQTVLYLEVTRETKRGAIPTDQYFLDIPFLSLNWIWEHLGRSS